jgi:2-polyprenyl-3-methyl-5-hydroxy-6-metoxy-1,4-benzoquinol methylase
MEIDILQDCPDWGAERVAEVEDRHFWFPARAALIRRELDLALGGLRGKSVLDIGCGTGYVLGTLERGGMKPTGCDMHQVWLDFARKRTTGELILGDANELPAGSYDSAILCDVIEHTTDDAAMLSVATRAVGPGGVVLVTVPAHQWLWTELDDISGHKRRYTRTQIEDLFRAQGYTQIRARYFNRLLLPVQALRKVMLRGQHDPDQIARTSLTLPPPWLNKIMGQCMGIDPYIWGNVLGASIIATGVKPAH